MAFDPLREAQIGPFFGFGANQCFWGLEIAHSVTAPSRLPRHAHMVQWHHRLIAICTVVPPSYCAARGTTWVSTLPPWPMDHDGRRSLVPGRPAVSLLAVVQRSVMQLTIWRGIQGAARPPGVRVALNFLIETIM